MTPGSRTRQGGAAAADTITRAELAARLGRGDAPIVVDTLPAELYRAGHIPGAINIVSDDIVAEAPRRLPDRDAEIVVYCASGPCKRSELAAERLRRLGYTRVRDYHGGRADWVAAGLALASGD